MQWKALVFSGLALIVLTGCSSSFGPAGGQLAITASTLPAGTVGTAYSYSVPATGGTPPYVWNVGSGTLPAGLKLSSKGTISGTPVVAGSTNFTLAVIDSEAVPASTTASFSIVIQSELAVTSLSPPAGTVGVSYSTTLAAAGGVTPYTWTLQSGSLPAGLSLNSAGVIAGTPSAGGTSTFTVQVADSESTQQIAIAQLNITINTITISTQSLPNGTVDVAYSAPLSAIGGVAPYTWTLSGTLPSGLGLNSAGVITGTPTAPGNSTFSVQVADSEQPPATASAQLSLTINSAGSSGTLQGNYVFYLNGFNSGGAWTLAGSFIADGNGNITSGVLDGNSLAAQPVNTTITGTYSVNSAGLNTMTIQGQSWGPMTLAFVLDSSGNGRIIEYDDTTGQGSRGAGALRQADASAFSAGTFAGNWAFGMTGSGTFGERFVNVGQFTVTTRTISNGSCDTNDGGSYQTCSFTGTLSAVDPQSGRATVTIQGGNGTNHEAVYVVSANELAMEQTDPTEQDSGSMGNGPFATSGGGSPLLVGSVLQQSGSFSNAALNSTAILHTQEIHEEDGLDQSIAGIISFDGSGNFNISSMDEDLAGAITQDQPSQGTYSIESNGALTINCGGSGCPAGFLITQNEAFVVGTGGSSSFGMIEAQTGAPFSNASIAGTYSGGSLAPLDYVNAYNEIYMGTADGLGDLTVNADSSSSNGLAQGAAGITYNIAANGRGTALQQGVENPAVVYMISAAKWVMLMPDADAGVGVFEQASTGQSQQRQGQGTATTGKR